MQEKKNAHALLISRRCLGPTPPLAPAPLASSSAAAEEAAGAASASDSEDACSELQIQILNVGWIPPLVRNRWSLSILKRNHSSMCFITKHKFRGGQHS